MKYDREKFIIYKKINDVNYFYGEATSLFEFITDEINEKEKKEHLESLYTIIQGVEIKLFDSNHTQYQVSY